MAHIGCGGLGVNASCHSLSIGRLAGFWLGSRLASHETFDRPLYYFMTSHNKHNGILDPCTTAEAAHVQGMDASKPNLNGSHGLLQQ